MIKKPSEIESRHYKNRIGSGLHGMSIDRKGIWWRRYQRMFERRRK